MNTVDLVRACLPVPDQLLVDGVDYLEEEVVVVRVSSTARPRCPVCASSHVSYHSQYQRRLRDLPWQGRQVQLRLRTRRFRCRNSTCPGQSLPNACRLSRPHGRANRPLSPPAITH